MNRADLPDEDEQYEALRALMRGMDGRPMTVRTLDVGGDKLAGGRWPIATAMPPTRRSACAPIRLSLKEPELLDAQLARDPARRRGTDRCASCCR